MEKYDAYYGQKRNKPILSKEIFTKFYPDFSLKEKLNALAKHSYLESTIAEDLGAEELSSKILSLGGTRIIMPRCEEDTPKLISRGQFWLGDKALLNLGEPSQCHRNSALLWEANRDKLKICTGYALSPDGIWRQHTWCIWAKPGINKIVETTVKRVIYFGYVMTEEECEEFLSWY